MSGRSLNRFVITGLVVLLGVLPVSGAQAAPADRVSSARVRANLLERQLHDLSRAFLQAFQELLKPFPRFQGDAQPGNSDPTPGPPPKHKDNEGVGIDPWGGRR